MKRISLPRKASIKDLYEVVYKSLELIDYGFSLFSDRTCKNELRSTRSLTVDSKFKHGDILYFKQMAGSSVRNI